MNYYYYHYYVVVVDDDDGDDGGDGVSKQKMYNVRIYITNIE